MSAWINDIRAAIVNLPEQFKTCELYQFEVELAAKHPENHNVRAKIRQQVQKLRDAGELVQTKTGWQKVKVTK